VVVAAALACATECDDDGACAEVVVDGATNIPAGGRAHLTVELCFGAICHQGSTDTGEPPRNEVAIELGTPNEPAAGGGLFTLVRGEEFWHYRLTTPQPMTTSRLTMRDEVANARLIDLEVGLIDSLGNCTSITIDVGRTP
jgi:hypothetical protein